MKRIALTLIIVSIVIWNVKTVDGQNFNQQDPRWSSGEQKYHCPNHPEVTATWPARCPKCGQTLVRQEQTRPAISGRARAEEMRRRIMLNTSISVFDPEAILSAKRPLALTREQINKLQAISLAAKEGAKKILTEKQRKELTTLDSLSNYPGTMAEMHRRILQGMKAPNSMMLDALLHQMRSRNFSNARRNTSVKKSDPPSSTTSSGNSTAQVPYLQSMPNNFSVRNVADPLNTNNSLDDPFGQNDLDNLDSSNNERDAYRDQYRDHYRDQLRDHYRDLFRDQYRDNFGGLGSSGYGEGFGNEGFGNEGFGNEGFGEGFGNQGFGEGFGNEGLGNEGFGEGFGNQGFGEDFGNEGFSNEGSGNEGLGGENFGNRGFEGGRTSGGGFGESGDRR